LNEICHYIEIHEISASQPIYLGSDSRRLQYLLLRLLQFLRYGSRNDHFT
jgi:hypothetical protein